MLKKFIILLYIIFSLQIIFSDSVRISQIDTSKLLFNQDVGVYVSITNDRGDPIKNVTKDMIKIYGTDTFFSTEKDLKNIDKHTRAGKNGKIIICPECKNVERVYHFVWRTATCPKCKKDIDKYDYYVLRA